MAMTEDFTLFFNAAEFAVSAVYTPAGGAAQPAANVIFDADGTVLEAMGIQTLGPSALVPSSQWPAVREGDGLVVTLPSGATSFKVRVSTPLQDGGLTLLTLVQL